MVVNDNGRNDQTPKVTQLKKKTVEAIVSSIGIILKIFDLVSSLEMSLHLSLQNTKHATNINCYFKECNLRTVEYILLSGKIL